MPPVLGLDPLFDGPVTGSVLLVVLIKVVVAFAVLLVAVMLYIWAMRKVIADMQNRIGPNRAGPYGVLQTLADGIKLFFKEGLVPSSAERFVFLLAPVLAMVPPFLAFAVIPFGAPVTLFGRTVPLQIADLDVGILWVLAMGSLGVYGVVLAGWSSGSNYPLLGSVRSSAQMISYEVGMGLALVAVLMYTGSLRMSEIVASQERLWNVIPQFPAFVAYLIAGLAETNRPPFDLAPRWVAGKEKLNPATVFNVSSDNDIIGGNSGSPLINAKGEVIGAIFDGNIHSLGGDFYFDPMLNRTVSVSTAAITEALTKIYGQNALVLELTGR